MYHSSLGPLENRKENEPKLFLSIVIFIKGSLLKIGMLGPAKRNNKNMG